MPGLRRRRGADVGLRAPRTSSGTSSAARRNRHDGRVGPGQDVPVLLTISTTHRPATDLGYLLHKHPDRVQEFRQSFGTSTVLYPEASDERCTVLLTLDIDPVRLARGRGRDNPAPPRLPAPRAVRQRPPVRRLEPAGRRHGRRVQHRPVRSLRQPPGAGRRADPARGRDPRAALPRRRRPRAPDLRAARVGGRRDADPAGRALPGVGRLALPAPDPARHGPAGRRAQPALRPAARPRRGQALLAGQRRGRQAAPLGR